MKKIILSLVLLFSLNLFANYDSIINIPDATFKAKLLAASANNEIASSETPNENGNVSTYHKIDLNDDGEIQLSEAEVIKWLKIDNSFITSLAGIESFSGLQYLNCNNNLIASLNIANLSNLFILDFNNNQLTALDLSGLTNLKFLDCENNQLTTLDLSGLTNLITLYCYNNQLTTLDLSSLINLQLLNCENNQLTTLDLSGLTKLRLLYCTYNQLTTLDLSLISLSTLYCDNNQLTTLITKNDRPFDSFSFNYHFFNNPNLQYICCSDNQINVLQQRVNEYGYTNCQVNTYCSFTPGGNFNTISGQFKYDFDLNGCDINDYAVLNAKLSSPSFTGSNTIYANNQGHYNGYTLQGTHTITPQIENPSLFNITPASVQITFENNNNNTQTQNFCVTPNGEQTDVEVIFTPLNPARPGFDADYKIVYRNIGNQTSSGDITLVYMNDIINLVSSSITPTNQTANQLIWNYQNLLPFESRTINLTFNINSPMETPPVNNGDFLSFGADITPLNSDINDLNNTSLHRQEVVGSYDPNDKTCLQGNTPGPEFIGQYVHYLIRFENTGTYFAENVVIRDNIDLTKFDINSLVVLDASHTMLNTRILNSNRVEFIFEGIQLPFPPSELRHGYVLFKIKTKSELAVGSTFANQAGIYFDYNWPIITNNETSTFTLLGTPNFEFSDLIALYPNPAKDVVNLSAKAGINLKSIEIYNTLGQLLMALTNDSNERRIDVSHLTSGTYMIKVNTDQGQGHTKFVKAP